MVTLEKELRAARGRRERICIFSVVVRRIQEILDQATAAVDLKITQIALIDVVVPSEPEAEFVGIAGCRREILVNDSVIADRTSESSVVSTGMRIASANTEITDVTGRYLSNRRSFRSGTPPLTTRSALAGDGPRRLESRGRMTRSRGLSSSPS